MDETKTHIARFDWIEVIPNTTHCKHGTAPCDKCGTSNGRDAVHTTRGGKGKVARIPKGS